MKIWHSSGAAKSVVGMNVGETAKSALYCGAVKIWPDNSTRWRYMELEFAGSAVDKIYWLHVSQRERLKLGWGSGLSVTAQIGGTKYNLWTSGMPLPRGTMVTVITSVYGANVTFADGEGPMVSEARVGDVISMVVTMPVLNVADYGFGFDHPEQDSSASRRINFPYIDGTMFEYRWWRGQKKANAHVDFYLYHEPSHTLFCKAEGEAHGDGRYWQGPALFGVGDYGVGNAGRVTYYMTGALAGSTGMTIDAVWWASASNVYLHPIFPAFSRTIKFKVKSLML